MSAEPERFYVGGAVGMLECQLDLPEAAPVGLALVAHPHPLYGGTMDNKVTYTLARAFVKLGYASVRMNFRGVGRSSGVYDDGHGETDDMALLLEEMRLRFPDLPVALAGFSFGSFVQACLTRRLERLGQAPERLVLVGAAAGKWPMPDVPPNTILIHGEKDDTIPLTDLYDWLAPQDLGVYVIPGADHFFHRKLHHIRDTIINMWRR